MRALVALALFLPALLLVADAARRRPTPAGDARWLVPLVALGLWAALSFDVAIAGQASIGYQGAAFAALILGYCRALLVLSLALAATVPPLLWGAHVLVDAVLPIVLTVALVVRLRRWAPAEPFVFLLGAGFFGLFAIGTVQLAANLALQALFEPTVDVDASTVGYGLLLLGGEVTLEGMLITMLVVYRPDAVALFDERHWFAARRML